VPGLMGKYQSAHCASGCDRIDHDQLRARPPGLFDEGPQVHVCSVDVGAPGKDVAGLAELLGLGASFSP